MRAHAHRFENLGLARRRLLGSVVGVGTVLGITAGILDRPWALFAGLALFALSYGAYRPLHAYSGGIEENLWKTLPSGARAVDEGDRELMYQVYEKSRWILGVVPVALLTYLVHATWAGWELPGVEGWGLVLLGVVLLWHTLPTVVWTWMEPGTFNLPYSAEDDLD